MANTVLLNNEKHKEARVVLAHGADYGENIHIVPILAAEVKNLALNFPLCLIKDAESGAFGLYALLGFEAGENLFLKENKWTTTNVPLNLKRQPFTVSFSEKKKDEDGNPSAIISIDEDSPRFKMGGSEGYALFDNDGSPTQFLNEIKQLLADMVNGTEATKLFVQSLEDNGLLEQLQLDANFANGENKSYGGLHTVNLSKLMGLKASVLKGLSENGYLQACYLLQFSIGHINKMHELKNQSLNS
ncbi:SapC family protein [Hirschia litorea]|uniref:SapC family protein n=1 Tax=Hirschia litorea TaxID=1199156 RepID=A0ABW2IPB5_9PROT